MQIVRALELCKRSRDLHPSVSGQRWHVAPAEQAAEPLLTWAAEIQVKAAQFITEYSMVKSKVIIILISSLILSDVFNAGTENLSQKKKNWDSIG